MMNDLINKLFDSFETKSKNQRQIFNDFVYHVYISFDGIVGGKKHKRKTDKYIKIRQKIINYIIANEKAIMFKLSR